MQAVIVHKQSEANRIEQEIVEAMLNAPTIEIPKGRPNTGTAEIQKQILITLAENSQFRKLNSDPVFRDFASNMCFVAARHMPWGPDDLIKTPQKSERFIQYLEVHYSLLKDAKLSNNIIRKHSHKHTLWETADTLSDASRVFGGDPNTKSLVRTAVSQVLKKRYASIEEAKNVYDEIIKEARRVFGTDRRSESLVRTATLLVFVSKNLSIEQLKISFDLALGAPLPEYISDSGQGKRAEIAAALILQKVRLNKISY